MTRINPPDDERITNYLELVLANLMDWPSEKYPSEELYCVDPWTHFNVQESMDALKLHEGGFFLVNRTETSGKTDGGESGCWRTIGSDKLIKSKKSGMTLGLKRILKFLPKKKMSENEKRGTGDQRKWVLEEYRLANEWNQDCVICKMRLMEPKQLGFLICDHMRGYYR